MKPIILSSKYQITIPAEIRKSMNLHAGTKMAIFPYQNRIRLIPLKPIEELRGSLKGMDTNIIREKEDRV